MNQTTKQIAALLGCTEAQVKAQFAANAKGLGEMLAKAQATGKKVNGYTAEQLAAMVASAKEKAGGMG